LSAESTGPSVPRATGTLRKVHAHPHARMHARRRLANLVAARDLTRCGLPGWP